MYNIIEMGDKKKEKLFISNYNQYKNKIYTYFLYRVNFNEALAEDLTSEAFLKAYKSWESFDCERSFQSWIYAISHNHLLNHYRTVGREVSTEETNDIATEFKNNLEASIELERIITEIYKMDNYCREVLLLRFVDGLENKEIADLLAKDESAVRTQMSRALASLRDKLNLNL